jgi:hypothetical protein
LSISKAITRVPHLRDGFIVDKVGIRAKREPLSLIKHKSHPTSQS